MRMSSCDESDKRQHWPLAYDSGGELISEKDALFSLPHAATVPFEFVSRLTRVRCGDSYSGSQKALACEDVFANPAMRPVRDLLFL
jgi:hypothetical protein